MEQNSYITLLKRVTTLVEHQVNASIREQDLTMSQGAALNRIAHVPEGYLPLKELEKGMKLSQPVTLGIVKRLEEKQYIESFVSPFDRRVKLVRATEQGRKQLAGAREIMYAFQPKLFAGFSEEETLQFGSYLLRLKDNLERDMEE